ncbi:hypothetical protein [Nonomuraea antri]|uniref:hypothetical protein n=1 Tax=Nonomuraea antri TaxID=2730852 RepID=UPI00156A4FE7|nr:hypothetical protein [Nonomuraea antri]
MGVDADREADPVFVQERFQAGRGHGVVVFEHRAQVDHGEVVAEGLGEPGRAVTDAARAQPLERLQSDHPAAQVGQVQGVAVEPVVCPAVSENPDGEQIMRQASWLWPSGRFRRIL